MTKEEQLVIAREDFKDFAIGGFPYDPAHSAMGEYHFYPPKGYRGRWYDPITCPQWTGPTWIITEDMGKKFMEQTRFQLPVDNPIANVCPMLVTGDAEWENYTLKATIRVLSRHSYAGILFRYISSRCHYGLYFEDGK